MKAAVYYGPEDIRATRIVDPALDLPHGIMVKVTATSICGSDLHLYRGAFDPIMEKGHSQVGHELIGEVIETGAEVTGFAPGDRVTMAYSCSCGDCHMCKIGQTAHCETTNKAVYGFGIPFGDLNGSHAEAMILPHADAHVIKVPKTISDAAALTLSCNLPSAIIANKLADIRPGEKVALVGCGPTGLMSLDIILSRNPACVVALDPVAHRRAVARKKGAIVLDSAAQDVKEQALSHCEDRGFDKVIEVVGTPESLQLSLDLIRPGGTISAIGVFCDPEFTLALSDVFLRDISLHMNGFANVQPFMAEGLNLMEQGAVTPEEYFSHEFALDDIDKAFRTFFDKSDNALKMLIRP